MQKRLGYYGQSLLIVPNGDGSRVAKMCFFVKINKRVISRISYFLIDGGEEMYIVHSIVTIPKGKEAEVIGLYQNRSRLVDEAPGFISFKLIQNELKREELTVVMEWENKDSYLDWVKSDQFKQIHDLEKKYPDKELASIKPIVRRYEVVAT
ncbi:antibiotic biosynthesis monooxygenase family protein [Salipaludibacillus daqingensis]|uniref:antibiotic biosynthesis monooxygenase family protein n=1 Tax=Salipaludibacillus daqingensis TaxID=3041001 RepID=UPI003CC86175